MKEEQVIALLPEYLDKTLSDEKMHEVERHLATSEKCKRALLEYQELYRAFDEEETLDAPASIRTNFFQKLEEEKAANTPVVSINKQASLSWSSLLKIAASIALLFGAFQFGTYQENKRSERTLALLQQQQQETKLTTMLALMENKSASKRILGVNYVENFEKPDDAIVDALVDRMLQDENVNVRLTAAEALTNFSNSEKVKSAFIKALGQENDPAIQITIIHSLSKNESKDAHKPLRELMSKEETQPFVKKEIESLFPKII